jgi:L-iditol 2-dehydrogenase
MFSTPLLDRSKNSNRGDNMLELFLNKPYDMTLRTAKELPPPNDDEVKIQLIYGGICGSDLRVFQGKLQYAAYPLRPGHELLGTIVAAGKNVNLELGTRVIVQPNTYCGKCKFCLSGKTNVCPEKKSFGVNVDGGFSEQIIMPTRYVLPIPDDLTDERAILIEPLAVIVHAFKKVHISEGTNVAIIGCGNEGMLAAALALHLGARVTALDINPAKFELVRSLGDITVLHPDEIHDEKFDVVIEAAGTSKSVELGFQLVDRGGTMILIGITQEATLPIVHVVRNEISFFGSIIYQVPDDFLKSMEYLKDNSFHVNPIVSKIIHFSEYKNAFDMAISGNYGKVVLKFNDA